MANRKFQLDQRVRTPLGDGTIDTMPYCEETDVYGVWLDRPHINTAGVNEGHWQPVSEEQIEVINA